VAGERLLEIRGEADSEIGGGYGSRGGKGGGRKATTSKGVARGFDNAKKKSAVKSRRSPGCKKKKKEREVSDAEAMRGARGKQRTLQGLSPSAYGQRRGREGGAKKKVQRRWGARCSLKGRNKDGRGGRGSEVAILCGGDRREIQHSQGIRGKKKQRERKRGTIRLDSSKKGHKQNHTTTPSAASLINSSR